MVNHNKYHSTTVNNCTFTDADDNEVEARVFNIVGRSALLEYRVLRIQSESQPEALD